MLSPMQKRISNAKTYLWMAHDSLCAAFWMDDEARVAGRLTDAVNRLTEAADALGYDLVKRP